MTKRVEPIQIVTLLFVLSALGVSPWVGAAPGDVIFEEQFNNNGDFVSDWSESGSGDASVDNRSFSTASNSLELSEGPITVTLDNNNVDALGLAGLDLAIWIRRGDDDFSENPDAGEDLRLDYRDDTGAWQTLATYEGAGDPGQIFNETFSLPADALYDGLQIRITLITGSGSNFDVWHIDNIQFIETGGLACATLFEEYFNNASDFTDDWDTSGTGSAAVNSLAFSTAPSALDLWSGAPTVTTKEFRIPANVDAGKVSIWLRRGSDDFSENPDNGEDISFEYLDNAGVWTSLETFLGSGIAGEAYRRNYTLASNALYSGLRFRFRVLAGGSGALDYWHVDDIIVSEVGVCDNTIPAVVAEWRLDEGSWAGVAGEVKDNSANALNGRAILLGALPNTANASPAIVGNPGTCRYGDFDGTSDGYVQIDDPGSNSVLDLDTEFTVSVWVYPRAFPGSDLATIVSKDENFEFHFTPSGQINWWWGGGERSLTSSTSATLNTWQHIAITYKAGNQVIYRNGAAVANNTSSAAITLNNDPVLLGTDLNIPGRRLDGLLDEVRIYSAELSQAQINTVMMETHPCVVAPTLDHFTIGIGSGNSSTCVPQSISITAEDSSNNTLTGYTGQIDLITSTDNGDWALTGTASDAQGTFSAGADDSGRATYTFEASAADQGSITMNLSNTHAELLVITASDSSAGVSSTSADLTFSENAFVVSSIDSLGDDVVAGRNHAMQIQMIRRDPISGECGPAANYNTASVKAWITRSGSDPAGAAPDLENASASDLESLGNSEPGSANFTLPFVNGTANFTLITSDVARFAFQFLDDSNGFSDQNIAGGSINYVVRPFGFHIALVGNPAASSAAGDRFVTAGANFTVSARAVAWSASDDADNDGRPDGHGDTDPSNNANLSNNTSVVSFGAETPAESLTLSSNLVSPVGDDPGLGSSLLLPADARVLSGFSNGSANTANVFFDEVGIIEIQAVLSDGNYLNTGLVATQKMQSRSGYVGRFYPSYLLVNGVSVTQACTGFSYMGQDFSVQYNIDAMSARNTLTSNYRGAFIKLPNNNITFGGLDTATSADLSARLAISSYGGVWGNGSGAFNTSLSVARAAAPDGDFAAVSLGVRAVDTDAVVVTNLNVDINQDTVDDHVLLGSGDFRFGRLIMRDAFGPETSALPVEFNTQYWNGLAWVENTADACTAIPQSEVSFPDGSIDTLGNRDVTVGAGTAQGQFADTGAGNINFSAGDAGMSFTAPGAGNTGTFAVDVSLNAIPWLRFDWDKDGNFSDPALPTSNFTFGTYRGHDRVIFWQEVLQ